MTKQSTQPNNGPLIVSMAQGAANTQMQQSSQQQLVAMAQLGQQAQESGLMFSLGNRTLSSQERMQNNALDTRVEIARLNMDEKAHELTLEHEANMEGLRVQNREATLEARAPRDVV